jgi:S1-C subfamily serine protease
VTRFQEVERAAQASSVTMLVLRDGKELELEVGTEALEGQGTRTALLWAGALLQRPHRALATQYQLPRDGVYVAWQWFGSPANRYGLGATTRIVAVDSKPTPDLDSFLAAVSGKGDRDSVRLKVLDLDDKTDVITLKLDLEFWKTEELRMGPDGWSRRPVSAGR